MVKIHVKRNILDAQKEDVMVLIVKLRSMSMGKPGYISGETLKRIDKPGESLVVTKWKSVHYWTQWFESEERSGIQNKIDQLLGEETQYEIYEYDPM
jgi:heme-degrading monooxygenase HmoA